MMLNYEKVIERFKNTFTKNGVIENDDEPFFGKASKEKAQVWEAFIKQHLENRSYIFLTTHHKTSNEYAGMSQNVDFKAFILLRRRDYRLLLLTLFLLILLNTW